MTRAILAWLASALVVTLVETWRALPDGSWSFLYLLLLFAITLGIGAAWTALLVAPAYGLARFGRWLRAREPQPLLWVGPALAACLIAGQWLHFWEAKTFVKHKMAHGFTPMIELVVYASIVGVAVAAHLVTRRWTTRIPRAVAYGVAGAMVLGAVLLPALRQPKVFEHGLVPVAVLALVALAVAVAAFVVPDRVLRWRPGRRTLAAALAVEAVLLLFAAYGGRVAEGSYPAALAAIRERQITVPRVMGALSNLADRDGDGFSPIFGGIDCDDGNARVNPFAHDVPGDGVDQDCVDGDLSRATADADLAALAALRERPPKIRTPNVLLITIDAARADAFGYAGADDPTPATDALAARGTVFTRAYTQAPMTRNAFPSLLAGKPPSRIHWLDQQTKYPYPVSHDDNVFLAEALAAAGIKTGFAVPFKYPVNAHFAQGFEDQTVLPASRYKKEINADKVVDAAIRALTEYQSGGRRFFLWVHFYEAHHPYVEHAGLERGGSQRDRYQSEIAWIDSQIARLVESVETLGLSGSTAIIFTGDHGEEFGEHGGKFHGDLHIEDLWVPLVIALPGGAPRAIDTPVSLLDLAPTIAELLGVPIPASFQGESVLPWIEGATPPDDRTVYAEVLKDRKQPRRLLTVLDKRWQLIADFQLGGRELYDLSRDPWGRKNRIADEPRVARDLELRLRRHMALRMGPVTITKGKAVNAATDEE